MTRRAAVLLFALVFSPLLHAAGTQESKATDLTGKWDGAFIISMNGQQQDDVATMVLTQKGAVLTGTVGPNVNQQWAIKNGKIDGANVVFEAEADAMLIKFTLTLVEGRLKGDAAAEGNGMSMTAKVDVGRSK
jgi:hypothetical protein